MVEGLAPGLEYEFAFQVPENKIVAALYPESAEFAAMPRVFATGFLVGLLEWTCIQAVLPYLDWPREQTVGIRIDITHEAPTPPGLTVTARVRLTEVDGRRLLFDVTATDGADVIGRGTHERAVVDAARFAERARAKEPSP
ncbi:MAG: thioesterase [Streptosporangiales bacterium]|nr:thioesterase [Streptosporangiales bacterium]